MMQRSIYRFIICFQLDVPVVQPVSQEEIQSENGWFCYFDTEYDVTSKSDWAQTCHILSRFNRSSLKTVVKAIDFPSVNQLMPEGAKPKLP